MGSGSRPAGNWNLRRFAAAWALICFAILAPRPVFAETKEVRFALGPGLTFLAFAIMEREKLVEIFKSLTPEQWSRTGTWPDGQVDVAWAAERALAHGLEHFTGLLFLHQELEHLHARQWLADA